MLVMRSRLLAVAFLPTLVCPPQLLLAQQKPDATKAQGAKTELEGYSKTASDTERGWEEKFRALPEPAKIREYMQRLSARPHHVGSPYDKDNAEWLAARFKEFGFETTIENFY